MLQDVLKHQPTNPIDFMMQYLEKSHNKIQGSKSTETFQPPSRPRQDVKTNSHVTGSADTSKIETKDNEDDDEIDDVKEKEKKDGNAGSSQSTKVASKSAPQNDVESLRQKARAGLDRGLESGKLKKTLATKTPDVENPVDAAKSVESALEDAQTNLEALKQEAFTGPDTNKASAKEDDDTSGLCQSIRYALESSLDNGTLDASVNELLGEMKNQNAEQAESQTRPTTAGESQTRPTTAGAEFDIEELKGKAKKCFGRGAERW